MRETRRERGAEGRAEGRDRGAVRPEAVPPGSGLRRGSAPGECAAAAHQRGSGAGSPAGSAPAEARAALRGWSATPSGHLFGANAAREGHSRLSALRPQPLRSGGEVAGSGAVPGGAAAAGWTGGARPGPRGAGGRSESATPCFGACFRLLRSPGRETAQHPRNPALRGQWSPRTCPRVG